MKTKNNKEKDLGIFYTPLKIVSFIFDLLEIIKNHEDKQFKRWQSHQPKKHYPSVIDPAVGEGIFLKTAIEKKYTSHDFIFGLDINRDIVDKWEKINLLKQFGGNEKDLRAHFFHQNGLDKIHWEQHRSKYHNKLGRDDINSQQFDAVVGNPPYGGAGLQANQLTDSVIENLTIFKLLPKDLIKELESSQQGLFQKEKKESLKEILKKRLKSFPIEILFLERFIQLAKDEEKNKPGGKIAVIIPDGILANSSYHYVREFIAEKTKVIAIISLPRETFKEVGTSAKTSILILRKKKESDRNWNYPVFLASTEKLNQENFATIVNSFKDFYYDQY
jgi:type I restriction-modification system DNA methylase subunit